MQIKSEVTRNFKSFFHWVEDIWGKEGKMPVTSIFSFTHNIFKTFSSENDVVVCKGVKENADIIKTSGS